MVASELLDELLVLVQLLQVVGGHGVDTVVLGTVKIVLVTNDTGESLVNFIHGSCRLHFLSNCGMPVFDDMETRDVERTRFSCWDGGCWAA